VVREPGEVPHFLPGSHDLLKRFTDKRGVPADAIFGGAATMYPEFQGRLRPQP
jgi:hypothetical protein